MRKYEEIIEQLCDDLDARNAELNEVRVALDSTQKALDKSRKASHNFRTAHKLAKQVNRMSRGASTETLAIMIVAAIGSPDVDVQLVLDLLVDLNHATYVAISDSDIVKCVWIADEIHHTPKSMYNGRKNGIHEIIMECLDFFKE